MQTFLPILSVSQVKQLKTDIKLLSNTVCRKASSKPFSVVSTQNSVAKLLGYTSFSELSLISQRRYKAENKASFSLLEEVNKRDLCEIYGYGYVSHYEEVIRAIQSKFDVKSATPGNRITLQDIKSAFDEGKINGGDLDVSTGLPLSFQVHQHHSAFTNFDLGSIFSVMHKGKEHFFTIVDEATMLSTEKPVFVIDAGQKFFTGQ